MLNLSKPESAPTLVSDPTWRFQGSEIMTVG